MRTSHVSRRSVAALAGVGAAIALSAGCSSSHSTSPANSSATTAVPGISALASAVDNNAGGSGTTDTSKLCAAVPTADVQKLFKATAPAVTLGLGECDWGSLTVDIYFDDASKQYYGGGGVNPATANALPGVGDVAVWQQPVTGETVPFVACHKGTTSVTVSPGMDVDQTTLTYTGSDPFYKIPTASAAQFAAEEGQLCTDIFAAAS